MFDNRILNHDRLGSKEEEESLPYGGWLILAHVRAENQAQVIQQVKYAFSTNGYFFSEKDNRYFIECNSCDSPIEVIPQTIRYGDTYSIRSEAFNVVLQSSVFGCKWREESNHREVCLKILSRIRKKRGFWLKDGKRFPIMRMKRLLARPKRHQSSHRKN